MKKLLLIDRDGTIIKEPPTDYQVDSYDKLDFLPGALNALSGIARDEEFELVMITNQDGLGTDSFPEDTFWGPHNLMLRVLEGEGIFFSEVLIDRTFAHENAPTRKPNTGLVSKYLEGDYDLANSFVIGDRLTDMQLALNIGAGGILIGISEDQSDDHLIDREKMTEVIKLKADSWKEIETFLRFPERKSSIKRKTNETDISIYLNLDGKGKANIETGLGFFDHMLEQLAKHSGSDIEIRVKGDLHIDEHHTIEDTALALGQAYLEALGDKKGIGRYGFLLPMDEALARVAIDFSGRPWLVWDAEFKREKVGDMPTEMFMHFFKSFSDTSKSTLNIKIEGDNEHHKIEAIFKGFAKSIGMAIKRDPEKRELPTTKGLL
ncbi:MAG: bifunctional histidinol-phosphatase/imidazoleglycerol-phosphate dehydratase HisB [Bacteroidota bacterium]